MNDEDQTNEPPPSRSTRRRFIAASAAATGGAWAIPNVAAAQVGPGLVSGPPPSTTTTTTTTTTTEPPPPPPDTCDLNNWTRPRTAGSWNVAVDGSSVLQTSNSNVTYLVSPDDLTGFTFDLFIEVETSSDNDFIGMAVGFTAPVSTVDPDHDSVLFSWKQGDQGAGLAGSVLARVDGTGFDEAGTNSDFWNHTVDKTGWTVLASDIASNKGWLDNTQYAFRVRYVTGPSGNIQIFRKPTAVDNVFPTMTPADKLFDVDGNFPPGKIAFYNFSQGGVRYIQANC